MKKKYSFSILFLIILFVHIVGCKKADDSDDDLNNGPVEIVDNSILTGDVNAPDFWDENNLVWNDEFDGNQLSDKNWIPQKYLGGVGNSELQNYTGKENLEVSNGTLKIKVAKTGTGQSVGNYTSGRLQSKFIFTYGRVEMRAKLPMDKGNGLWVKLWLLGSDFESLGFPASGVIDFMNYMSHVPNQFIQGAITSSNFNNRDLQGISNPLILESAEEEFHKYGILWTDKYINFYLDDIKNVTFTYLRPENANPGSWPFDRPFYFIMNIAVGGEFGGVQGVDDSMFPTQMEIDYVRVYHGKK